MHFTDLKKYQLHAPDSPSVAYALRFIKPWVMEMHIDMSHRNTSAMEKVNRDIYSFSTDSSDGRCVDTDIIKGSFNRDIVDAFIQVGTLLEFNIYGDWVYSAGGRHVWVSAITSARRLDVDFSTELVDRLNTSNTSEKEKFLSQWQEVKSFAINLLCEPCRVTIMVLFDQGASTKVVIPDSLGGCEIDWDCNERIPYRIRGEMDSSAVLEYLLCLHQTGLSLSEVSIFLGK